MFCKHQWKLLDKTIIPSKWETINKDRAITKLKGDAISVEDFCIQKVILSFTCEKCGKLKVITESN